MIKETVFETGETCCRAMAKDMARQINFILKTKRKVSLAVSGGTTPTNVFKALSKMDLDWSRVQITLTDERWVDVDDADSTERLVRDHLLQGFAEKASFIPFKTPAPSPEQAVDDVTKRLEAIRFPIDLIYLGMGGDGHIASLFPEIMNNGDDGDATVVPVLGPKAPFARLSLAMDVIVSSRQIYLQLSGAEKKATFERAKNNDDNPPTPLQQALARAGDKFKVFISNS